MRTPRASTALRSRQRWLWITLFAAACSSESAFVADAASSSDVLPADTSAAPDTSATPDVASDLGPEPTDIHEVLGEVADTTEPPEIAEGDALAVDACPVALGAVTPGLVVTPLTTLGLSSAGSYAAPGRQVAQVQWTVEGPSAPPVVPSATFPTPTIELDVLGTYTVRLDVWDSEGVQSCVPWTKVVTVKPGIGLEVELTWTTPGDPDETDEDVGSDLDIHLVHRNYADPGSPWYNLPFDCFWFNPNPSWGSLASTDDDPNLTVDDTAGLGPEIIVMKEAQPAATYGIGVHYCSDGGFGDSFATVRVHVDGAMVYEAAGVQLSLTNFWEVASVDGTTYAVTPVTNSSGGYAVDFLPCP